MSSTILVGQYDFNITNYQSKHRLEQVLQKMAKFIFVNCTTLIYLYPILTNSITLFIDNS